MPWGAAGGVRLPGPAAPRASGETPMAENKDQDYQISPPPLTEAQVERELARIRTEYHRRFTGKPRAEIERERRRLAKLAEQSLPDEEAAILALRAEVVAEWLEVDLMEVWESDPRLVNEFFCQYRREFSRRSTAAIDTELDRLGEDKTEEGTARIQALQLLARSRTISGGQLKLMDLPPALPDSPIYQLFQQAMRGGATEKRKEPSGNDYALRPMHRVQHIIKAGGTYRVMAFEHTGLATQAPSLETIYDLYLRILSFARVQGTLRPVFTADDLLRSRYPGRKVFAGGHYRTVQNGLDALANLKYIEEADHPRGRTYRAQRHAVATIRRWGRGSKQLWEVLLSPDIAQATEASIEGRPRAEFPAYVSVPIGPTERPDAHSGARVPIYTERLLRYLQGISLRIKQEGGIALTMRKVLREMGLADQVRTRGPACVWRRIQKSVDLLGQAGWDLTWEYRGHQVEISNLHRRASAELREFGPQVLISRGRARKLDILNWKLHFTPLTGGNPK